MSRRNITIILFSLFVVFLVLRLPGIDLPYYQDEWKNVIASETIVSAGSFFAHPPLMQISFVVAYAIFGVDYFRLFPLLFSLATGIILFIVVKRRLGQGSALWSLGLFALCFYSVLGSIQPDVDGSIIPFILLFSIYFYDKWLNLDGHQIKWKWFPLLTVTLLIGLLFKLSFILVVGAIVIDYLWINRRNFRIKDYLYTVLILSSFGIIYVALLYLIQIIYPAFDIKFMLGHAGQFSENMGRDYIQIIVQGIKSVYYLSPLLLIPFIYLSKESIRKNRIFIIYLIVGFIFYFILFDFSRGVLDKYLMFMIVPFSVIVGNTISNILEWKRMRSSLLEGEMRWPILIGIIISAVLFYLNFLPHNVLALYPKTEWFSKVLHGQWNFLNPFNGGSGPMGFYVSFLFIAVSFISSFILGIIGLFKKKWKHFCLIFIIMIGVIYNLVLSEELMFGKINGSSADVLKSSVEFIGNTSSIQKVMSYNDIGNHEISEIGKWKSRFYAAPQFENNHRQIFADFDGQYLVVDIPHINEDSFYGKFLAECDVLFETFSGKIAGKVYDCPYVLKGN